MKFPQFCVRRPVFTTVLSLIIIVVGIIGFMRIPLRGYPNVTRPVITITTDYTGASASIIESQITTPIENALAGASGLDDMRSYSKQGRSRVILQYHLGVNLNSAYSDVQNLLSTISRDLPENVDPPIIQKSNPNSLQTVVVGVTDSKMSEMGITDYVNRYILPQLQQVVGVSSVNIYNARDYAMLIQLEPKKMAANSVTVTDLTNILEQQNVDIPSGQIKTPDRYYSVLAQGQLQSAQAFRNLIIRQKNGYMLRFGDVAKVEVGPENTDSAMRVNGKTAVGLGVYAESTANPISVASRVEKTLKQLQRGLPAGMKIKVVFNNTSYLKASLVNVYHDMIFALLLVVVVVLLFLGSWRSAIIPVVTIPICLIGVCALMYMMGYSLNLFTLLALVLAVGLVVDDAIVMLENIYRHVEAGMSPVAAALKGSKEIAFAIVAMTLTLAAVYAPIGFATGMSGIIFRQFAFTLALAVFLSGFVALSLSPMMCGRFLRLPANKKSLSARYQKRLDIIFTKLIQAYKNFLRLILNWRSLVTLILLVVAAGGYFTFKSLPSELSPKEDMGVFLVSVTPPPNASFAYTNKYTKQLEKLVMKIPQVTSMLTIVDPSFGGFGWVDLKPWSERKVSAQQLIHKVDKEARNIPGVQIGAFNVSQIGGGGRYGSSVRVVVSTNQTFLQLHTVVKQFLKEIAKYPGILNPQQSLIMNDKQFIVHVNRNMAAALQVSMGSITKTLQTMVAGARVTSFDWQDRDYDVWLQIPQKSLSQLQIVNELYVRNAVGTMVPLSSLVSISSTVAPQELPHDNRLRADIINMQVANGYSMGQVVNYLQTNAHQLLPSGYVFGFKGVAKRLLQSRHTMMGAFTLAIVFIYLVMAAQFESFIDPFIILFTVPLAIVGALFTLKLTGHSMSIYTDIGFVTLIGLIAKHGILITEFANQKRAAGMALKDALIDAAALRLRPILMTTSAMVIGAVPLALAQGAGSLSRQHVGWVIVGGLLFGTFFSLIVVPVAYSFFGKFKKIVPEV